MKSKTPFITLILVSFTLSCCSVGNWAVSNAKPCIITTKDAHSGPINDTTDSTHTKQPISSTSFSTVTSAPSDSTITTEPNKTSAIADSILGYAKLFLGKPYGRGCSGPDRFDCSGFTSFVYGHFGFNLFRSSREQMANGTPIARQAELRPGDLVFYGGRKHVHSINHVGIVIENDTISKTFTFIHACSRGIAISHSNEKYYYDRYISACRIIGDTPVIRSNPNGGTSHVVDPTASTVATPSPSNQEYHIINEGDTLTKIAKKHHTTVNKLCEINHINKSKILQPGKEIRVK